MFASRDPLRPLFGTQDLIRISPMPGSVPVGSESQLGKPLQGLTLSPGTWLCDIDTGGIQTIEAHVAVSAIAGAPTISFNSLHADGGNYQASTPAGGALVANTQQDLPIILKGEQRVRLTITVPAGGSAGPFTRACFNGL